MLFGRDTTTGTDPIQEKLREVASERSKAKLA